MKRNDEDLVLIYQSGSLPEVAVVKSLLDSQQIRYVVYNENSQNLFGIGQTGTNFNVIVGPVRILVHKDDAENAKQLLNKK